jgi:2-haloacid dehalogenase
MAQEALAFDMYGTLVNPIRIWQHLTASIGPDAQHISELWRQKQLEYTFRLTAMEQYEDFAQVTRYALDYALIATGYTLTDEQKQQLMEQYNDLEPFSDTHEGLQRLQQKGHTMVVFSNGTPRMLSALMKAAQLDAYMQGFISVDEVRTYKPSPRVYQLVGQKLARPLHEIRLISSNPFDIIGAMSAGMQAAWVDRSGSIFDPFGPHPTMVVKTLVELADALH